MSKAKRVQVWWCMLIIPVLGRLGQEDSKFEASLAYIARPMSQKPKTETKQNKKSKKENMFLSPPHISASSFCDSAHSPHTSALSAWSLKPSCYKWPSPVAHISPSIPWRKAHQHTLSISCRVKGILMSLLSQ